MKQILIPAIFAAVSLSACSSGSSGTSFTAESQLASVDRNGEFQQEVDVIRSGSMTFENTTRSRDAEIFYEVGEIPEVGYLGQAGFTADAVSVATPTTGTVTYEGQYEVAYIADLDLRGSSPDGTGGTASGALTLEADFDDLSVMGTSDDGRLVVNVESNMFNHPEPMLEFDGAPGRMGISVSEDFFVGAVQGSSDDMIFAGGFVTEAQ